MKLHDTARLSPIMTPKEVAEYLQIHTATLYILIRRGEIPSFKIGTDHRFRRDEIEKWLAEKQQTGDSKVGEYNNRAINRLR